MRPHYMLSVGLLFCGAIVACPNAAFAQGRITSAQTELLLDAPLVVSAGKKLQRIDKAPTAITVITAAQIREMGAVTILDALRYAPGVDVVESNGAAADVAIRGFNYAFSNKTLVLLDGLPLANEFFGGVYWHTAPLLLSRISRIEVVRGPGSALYGANAFNGVINIITKTAKEMAAQPAKTSLLLLTGEHRAGLSEAQSSIQVSKDCAFSVGAKAAHFDGMDGVGSGGQSDTYSVPTVTLDLQRAVGRGSLTLAAANAESQADYAEQNSWTINGHWHRSDVSMAYVQDANKTPLTARICYSSFYQTEPGTVDQNEHSFGVEAQQQAALLGHQRLVYGVNYKSIQGVSNQTGPDSHRQETAGVFFQDDFNLNKKSIVYIGGRFDWNSLFGSNFSPRATLMRRVAPDSTLRVSVGQSFRNPTMFEKYFDVTLISPFGPPVTFSSAPGIRPERITNYEIGFRHETRRGFVATNLFYNQVKGLISMGPSAISLQGIPTAFDVKNRIDATAIGLELEGEWKVGRATSILMNYTFQDLEGSDGNPISLSPKSKFNIGVRTRMGARCEAFLGAHFVGSSYLVSVMSGAWANPYTRVDARLGYRFGAANRSWILSLGATNLFDDRHLEYPVGEGLSPMSASLPQRRTVYVSLTGKL